MKTLEAFLEEWNNDSEVVLVHTSGSTGKPKPLWVEKQRMLDSARITCDFLNLKEGDTALLCMPLDYIAGKMMVVRSLERKLQLLSVKPSGNPLSDISLSALENPHTPITFAAMVPLQVYNTLQNSIERERLKQIKHLIIGGGAIDEALMNDLKNFPNAVWSTYGMTETLSHIALRRLNGKSASHWYEPFDNVTLSQTTDECLVINAPLVCADTLTTNDRVEFKIEENGCGQPKTLFRIIGRKDNVINSGGVKIQIEEVEQALKPYLTVPFAITKRKNLKFGEEVVLLTEAENITEIAEICTTHLPKYCQPRYYQSVSSVPRTETGKIARAAVLRLVDKSEPLE